MATTVSIPSTDLSGQGIQQLFPQLWGLMTGASYDTAGGAGAGVLAEMMKAYNSFAAFALGIVVLYIMIVGIANTAHEGTPLGRAWNALWTPIRIVGGMLLCVPVAALGGYSILQAGIIFCVALSVYGANLVYANVINYWQFNSTILPVTAAQLQPEQVETILQSQICKHAYNSMLSPVDSNGITANVDMSNGYRISWVNSRGDPVCGEIVLDCASISGYDTSGIIGTLRGIFTGPPPKYEMCKAVGNQYAALVSAIDSVAAQAIDLDSPISDGMRAAVQNAARTYYSGVTSALQAAANAEKSTVTQGMAAAGQAATADGWLSAGSWFFAISAKSGEIAASGDIKPSSSSVRPEQIPLYTTTVGPAVQRAREIVGRSANGVVNVTTGTSGGLTRGDAASDDALNMIFGKPLINMQEAWRVAAKGIDEGDPMQALAGYGHTLLGPTAVSLMVGVKIAEKAKLAVDAAQLAGLIPGGQLVAGAAMVGSAGLEVGIKLTYAAITAVIVGGIALAYYLPMIPTLYWYAGVLGWMVSLLLALLAAPLWAASHALPDQSAGPAGMRAMQGYQLLTGVVLKPITMTISLFAAYIISSYAIKLVTHTFGTAIDSAIYAGSSGGMGSILGAIVAPLIYIVLVITIMKKSYDVVITGADHILGWIGAATAALGTSIAQSTSEALHGAHGGTQGTHSVGGAAAEATKAVKVGGPKVSAGKTET